MNENCFRLLIVNAIAYIALFIYYQWRKKSFDLGSIILLAWVVGSCGSVYFYTFPVAYLSYSKLTLAPLIYLFCINIFLFSPFLRTNYNDIKIIETYNLSLLLKHLSIIFSIVGILPFVNILLKLSSFSFGGNTLAAMYDSDVDNTTIIFYPVIRPFYSILRHFIPFIIFLFVYNLSKRDKIKWIVIGLGMNTLTFFLVSILSGSRGGVISILVTCIFFVLIMKNMIEKKTYLRIKQISIIGLVGLVLGISAISISRLARNNARADWSTQTMDLWISQYAGEGIVRFDNTIWNLNKTLNGTHNLDYIISLDDASIKDSKKYNLNNEIKINIILSVFYTYVGDVLIDFGKDWSIPIFIILYLLIKYLFHTKDSRLSFYKVIILSYMFQFLTIGFTANIYRSYYNQTPIVDVLLLLLGLKIFSTFSTQENQDIDDSEFEEVDDDDELDEENEDEVEDEVEDELVDEVTVWEKQGR